jgi:RimJ/RimL family protein N-acetyltransferase
LPSGDANDPKEVSVLRRREVESPVIVLDEFFRLDQWRAEDASGPPALRSRPRRGEVLRMDRRAGSIGTRFALPRRDCKVRPRLAGENPLLARHPALSDGEAVGSVELRPTGSEADVSYLVVPELRGQSLASRALVALIAWGTRELGLQRVNLACHVDNIASRRVAEKSGFVYVCREGDELRFRRDTTPA